ncbi:DUF4271 domain-containing protein [Persicobacter psychrovividus]|uniref:DUF4271 domain-containing protein n=1 Tax=Persicobacter psychrovividus TaxID=387638 RepID=A0ABN6LF00_9BACT|nr:hypothetical protein PEPS_25180 [Persicobacter psychrovividus]
MQKYKQYILLLLFVLSATAPSFSQVIAPVKDTNDLREYILNASDSGQLQITIPAHTAVFIDQAPYHYFSEDTLLQTSIMAIQKPYGATQEALRLGFLRCGGTSGIQIRQAKTEVNKKKFIELSQRSEDYRVEFLVISLIVLLAFYALYMNAFPYAASMYLSLFPKKNRADGVLFRGTPFTKENAVLLIFHSFALAILIGSLLMRLNAELIFSLGWETIIFYFLLSVLLIVFFFYLKYLFLLNLGSVLSLKETPSFHFLEYLRLSIWYVNISLLAVLVISISGDMRLITPQIITFIVLFMGLFRTLWLAVKLGFSGVFSYVNLFSYLCASEILPLFIAVKIVSTW